MTLKHISKNLLRYLIECYLENKQVTETLAPKDLFCLFYNLNQKIKYNNPYLPYIRTKVHIPNTSNYIDDIDEIYNGILEIENSSLFQEWTDIPKVTIYKYNLRKVNEN